MSTLNDLQREWLVSNGATPGTLNDMWLQFLGDQGHTGSLPDRMNSWLIAQGATPGGSWNDLWVDVLQGAGGAAGAGSLNNLLLTFFGGEVAVPQVLQSDYPGDRSMWTWRFTAETDPEYNTAWDDNTYTGADETDAWAYSQANTNFLVETLRAGGYNKIILKADMGFGSHFFQPDTAIWHSRRDYAALRPTSDDPLAYLLEQANAAGFKVCADFNVTRTFDAYYDGTSGKADYLASFGAGTNWYDLGDAAFRTRYINYMNDVMDRYPTLYEIGFDYLRSGDTSNTLYTALEYQGWAEDILDGVIAHRDANHPSITFSVWGHNETGRLDQGNNPSKWVDDGRIDIAHDGSYGLYPIDSQMDPSEIEACNGMGTPPTSTVGDVSAVAFSSANILKQVAPSSGHYMDNAGNPRGEMMTTEDREQMFFQQMLMCPNANRSMYVFHRQRDTDLANDPNKFFNNNNREVVTERFDTATLGKLYYRRYGTVDLYDSDGVDTGTNLGDHEPAIAFPYRTEQNYFDAVAAGVTSSEDVSGATVDGAENVSGNTYSLNSSSPVSGDRVEFNGAYQNANGAATLRARLRITTAVDGQLVRVRLRSDSDTQTLNDYDCPTAGTYDVYTDEFTFTATGADDMNLWINVDRNVTAGAEVTIDDVAVTVGSDPIEYIFTTDGTATQDYATQNATSVDVDGFITDAVGEPLPKGTIHGPQIAPGTSKGTLAGLKAQPLDRTHIVAGCRIHPKFNSSSGPPNTQVLFGGECDSDNFWQARMFTTGNIGLVKEVGGAQTVVNVSQLDVPYSVDDQIYVRAEMSEDNGTLIQVINETTGASDVVADADNDSLPSQHMIFVGSRLGRDSKNNGDIFHLREMWHGRRHRGVHFGGSQAIYNDQTAISTYPFTLAAWVRVPSGGAQVPVVSITKGITDYGDYVAIMADNSEVQWLARGGNSTLSAPTDAHGKSPGDWMHVAIAVDSATSRRCYIDGALVRTVTGAAESVGLDTFAVGGRYYLGSMLDYYTDTIYSAAIWDSALSTAQIGDLGDVADPSAPDTIQIADLVAYLPLQDGTTGASESVGGAEWTVDGAAIEDGRGDSPLDNS